MIHINSKKRVMNLDQEKCLTIVSANNLYQILLVRKRVNVRWQPVNMV
jgi:hypothetical protein